MKTFIFSIGCGVVLMVLSVGSALADDKDCKSGDSGYCINVALSNEGGSRPEAAKGQNDFCYILQLNGSDRYAAGSIPVEQLPTALFRITQNHASIGKPLSFKIIKAQIVPSGQCDVRQASLQPVYGCDIFEYAAIAGVSRYMTLTETKNNAGYVCSIKN